MEKKKKLALMVISVASVLFFIGFWYLATEVLKLVSPMIVPSPRKVFLTFLGKFSNPNPDGAVLMAHVWASLQVALLGFILGSLIGVPLGVGMAWYPRFDMLAKPLFDLMRPIPPIAWIPLMILWFGIGLQAKAGVIFLSAFIPCVINAYSGIKLTSAVHIWVASTFGATHWEILWKVAIPTAIPSIFTGMRISLGLAWTSLVAAELLAATQGLGFMIQVARMLGRPDIIMVGMLTIGGIGALLAFLLEMLERVFVKDGR
jgi:NitT/TauT family transport system permease protein/taurine transport system permease protein